MVHVMPLDRVYPHHHPSLTLPIEGRGSEDRLRTVAAAVAARIDAEFLGRGPEDARIEVFRVADSFLKFAPIAETCAKLCRLCGL